MTKCKFSVSIMCRFISIGKTGRGKGEYGVSKVQYVYQKCMWRSLGWFFPGILWTILGSGTWKMPNVKKILPFSLLVASKRSSYVVLWKSFKDGHWHTISTKILYETYILISATLPHQNLYTVLIWCRTYRSIVTVVQSYICKPWFLKARIIFRRLAQVYTAQEMWSMNH